MADDEMELPNLEDTSAQDNPDGAGGAHLAPDPEELTPKDLDAVYSVPIQISAVLGRATMPVSQVLKLGRGAVVELDRRVGEAIDIFVNDRLIARGEVVIVDEHLGVTMTEILKVRKAAS